MDPGKTMHTYQPQVHMLQQADLHGSIIYLSVPELYVYDVTA